MHSHLAVKPMVRMWDEWRPQCCRWYVCYCKSACLANLISFYACSWWCSSDKRFHLTCVILIFGFGTPFLKVSNPSTGKILIWWCVKDPQRTCRKQGFLAPTEPRRGEFSGTSPPSLTCPLSFLIYREISFAHFQQCLCALLKHP